MKKNIIKLCATLSILLLTGCNSTDAEKQKVITDNTVVKKAITDKSSIQAGQNINFSASSDGVKYEWLSESGKLLSNEKSFNRAFFKEGNYKTFLNITNADGKVSSSEIEVRVSRNSTPSQTDPNNEPPVAVASISEYEICEGEGVTFFGDDSSDSDGSIIDYTWRDMDGILLSNDAVFSRGFPYAATYHKTLIVTDDKGAKNNMTVNLVVKDCNSAPIAEDINASTQDIDPVVVTLAATDPDGDSLIYTIITPPTLGELSGTAPNLTYTPFTHASVTNGGLDNFTYRVNDGSVDSNIATVNITITHTTQSKLIKTGQIQSYNAEGMPIDDGSIKDDGYYQAGVDRNFTRDDVNNIVIDNVFGLAWQDNSDVGVVTKRFDEVNDNYCHSTYNSAYTSPSIESLFYLKDHSKDTIDEVFQNGGNPTKKYWSDTSDTLIPYDHGLAMQYTHNLDRLVAKSEYQYVRCVTQIATGGYVGNFTRDDDKKVVIDSDANLMWQDNEIVTNNHFTNEISWEAAINYCEGLDFANYQDWRLPNINELYSIGDRTKHMYALKEEFSDLDHDSLDVYYYWSSTSSAEQNFLAQTVEFGYGRTGVLDKRELIGDKAFVRCVRTQ